MDPITGMLISAGVGLGMDLFGLGTEGASYGQESAAIQGEQQALAQVQAASQEVTAASEEANRVSLTQAAYDTQRAIRLNTKQGAILGGESLSNVTLAGAGMSSAAIGSRQQIEGQTMSANTGARQNFDVTQQMNAANQAILAGQGKEAYYQSVANQYQLEYSKAASNMNLGGSMIGLGSSLISQSPTIGNVASAGSIQLGFGGGYSPPIA